MTIIDLTNQTLRQQLGLDRSAPAIQQSLRASIGAVHQGTIFGRGGLCGGYSIVPMSQHYFVAQEFNSSRDDLRYALNDALLELGVTPVCADDSFWPGHILCKISALIHATPFGVYQLTTSQNRNVYLELGIAIGLFRPFVLLKDKDAAVSPLTLGLEYFPINSYLEMRMEFGQKLNTFLADIVRSPQIMLPPPGSKNEVFVSHGDLEPIDFCATVGRVIREQGSTVAFANEPGERLKKYLHQEQIPFRVLGTKGGLLLNETIEAIQNAQMGIYRIEKMATPDAFVMLGISLGLNRPGILVHRKGVDVPSDVQGINALKFDSLKELSQLLKASLEMPLRKNG